MKKILFLLVLGLQFILIKPPVLAAESVADQRFGLAGGCTIASDLNIPWVYDWGQGFPYPNKPEEDCLATGRKTFFSVGVMGGKYDYSSDPNYNIPKLEQTYLKDSLDLSLYQRLKTVLTKINTYSSRYGNLANEQRALSGFLLIPKYTADHPGLFYAIDNEPDAHGIHADDYAEYFNIFYTQIKRYDSSANIMVGGLSSFLPFLTGNNGHPNYQWLNYFRNSYKSAFGIFPPTAVWNIHPYAGVFDWHDPQNTIIDFKDNFLVSIGETNTPIWATEFGYLAYRGDINSDFNTEQSLISNNFLQPLVTWLKTSNYVQKWFWYIASSEADTDVPGRPHLTLVFKQANGQYNLVGQTYQQLANTRLAGDLNADGKVDNLDLISFLASPSSNFDYNNIVTNYGKSLAGYINITDFLQNFGKLTCGNIADFNEDCKVDNFDYNLLVSNYGH